MKKIIILILPSILGIVMFLFLLTLGEPSLGQSLDQTNIDSMPNTYAKVANIVKQNSEADRIIFGNIGEASNLIPWLTADSASHEIADLIYIAPLRMSGDLEPELWAAEKLEEEDDGKLLRFTLRKGILWEDGTELTAADVEYTWKVVTDPKTASPYADDYLQVESFKVIDRYSFEVRYKQYFARAISSWMSAILPKHLLEGQDLRSSSFARKPIGAGPYRLKVWEAGDKIVLEASQTYFLGKPQIEQIVFRTVPDLATMFMETSAGNLDFMGLTPEQYRLQAKGKIWEDNFAKYRYLGSNYVFLGFNMLHPFFQDLRVRHAISCAIDRRDIINGVLLGEGVAAFGPYKPGTWAYHKELQPIKYDPDRAKQLLAEAGFSDSNGDGILDRDGKDFAFTILTNQGNEQRILAAVVMQSQLKKLGIAVQIRTVEWAAFIHEFVNKGNFDAVILGWTISNDPDLYQVWHSSQAFAGGLNFTRYKNQELDRLLEEARISNKREIRQELYAKVQEILHKEQPYCFLFVPYSLPVVQKRFQGIRPATAGIMYNFEQWWVKQGEARYKLLQ